MVLFEFLWIAAPTGEFIVLLGDFSADVSNDSITWTGVVGRNSLPDLSLSGVQLLDFCAGYGLCTWHQDTLSCRLMINFILAVCVRHLDEDRSRAVKWWQGRMPDRPGSPMCFKRVCWENLAEDCQDSLQIEFH